MSHPDHRQLLTRWAQHLYDFDLPAFLEVARASSSPDMAVHLCHPLGSGEGIDFFAQHLNNLAQAWPDLERREYIQMAGPADDGDWVGCGGYYTGVSLAPWLDIPATGHQLVMRFHEFFKIQDGKVVEIQAIWDIPEVMFQVGCWPLAPALGKTWAAPAPATCDGMLSGARNESRSAASQALVVDMLTHLSYLREGGVEAMKLDQFWHPKMNWYGPAGIGTNRGIQGFRHWHQIPWRKAFTDSRSEPGSCIFFADGDYVAVTGWPNMNMTWSGDGLMGVAGTGKEIEARSLDFWRCENGLIRENWVLVDLLHMYQQIGVDVFERMRELSPLPLNRGRLPG